MSSERQEHDSNSPWWGEHVFRYEHTLSYIGKNDNVLDIACGNGVGTYLIANHSKGKITGGDIDLATVDACRKKWNISNLRFEVCDGTALSFETNSLDAVVSFETIEHTKNYQTMIAEFYRVLKPGGMLILSTPNFIVNSPEGIIYNPYHTQEFTYDQLNAIIKSSFENFELFGQEYIRYKVKKKLNYALAKQLERLFYFRGIRKLPLSVQNFVINTLISKPQYPTPEDYALTREINEIKKCKTFFAVCRK